MLPITTQDWFGWTQTAMLRVGERKNEPTCCQVLNAIHGI